jgi:sulfatase maturation enzyme AslB (radical SAM superfamily)
MRWFGYKLEMRRGKIWNEHCEINAAEHCNLACRACSHLSPIQPRSFVDPNVVYEDLTRLAKVYHADRVSVLGGEPLLHPRLADVIRAARESNVADGVRVVTNGVLLHRMDPECWKLLNEVRVSVYPGFELDGKELDECRRLADENDTTLQLVPMDTFFETYAMLGTKDEKLVKKVYATCKVAHLWRCHLVSNGWLYKCPHTYFLAKQLGFDAHEDGIALSDDPSFAKDLAAYIKSPVALKACTFCLGTVGKRIEHGQVRRDEWAAMQNRTMEELIDRRLMRGEPRYV